MTKPRSEFLFQFSRNLKSARENAGFTQKQLAEMLFVSPNSICMYEKGRRAPSLEMTAIIAKITGVNVDDLLPEPDMSFLVDDNQMNIDELFPELDTDFLEN